jgi:hypothetical protein
MAHQGASEYARAPSRKRDGEQLKSDGDEESDSECSSSGSDSPSGSTSGNARPVTHKRPKQVMHGEGAPGDKATAYHSMVGGSIYDLIPRSIYEADPRSRLFLDTRRITDEFAREHEREGRFQVLGGQPRQLPPPTSTADAPPSSSTVPPPAPPPPPSSAPEAPKKPRVSSTPPLVKLESRPLPSPTDYLERVFSSGLLPGIRHPSRHVPRQESMTQRIRDPRVTKATVAREKRELAIAKRRAGAVRGGV